MIFSWPFPVNQRVGSDMSLTSRVTVPRGWGFLEAYLIASILLFSFWLVLQQHPKFPPDVFMHTLFFLILLPFFLLLSTLSHFCFHAVYIHSSTFLCLSVSLSLFLIFFAHLFHELYFPYTFRHKHINQYIKIYDLDLKQNMQERYPSF